MLDRAHRAGLAHALFEEYRLADALHHAHALHHAVQPGMYAAHQHVQAARLQAQQEVFEFFQCHGIRVAHPLQAQHNDPRCGRDSSIRPARGTVSMNDISTPIITQNSTEIATAENAVTPTMAASKRVACQ